MVSDARRSLGKHFLSYNLERIHESLGYRTPYEIYVKERLNLKPMQAINMRQVLPTFLS
jgi:transposase InsO family protein